VDQVPVHCGARFSANARALLGVAGRLDPLPFTVILGPGDCLLAVLGGLEHQMRDHLRGERGTPGDALRQFQGGLDRLGRLKDRDGLPVRRPVEGDGERESGAQPAGVDPVDPGMQPGAFVELDQPGDGAWGGCAPRRAVMDDGPARESSGAPGGFPG
jgi:hypothetical protein